MKKSIWAKLCATALTAATLTTFCNVPQTSYAASYAASASSIVRYHWHKQLNDNERLFMIAASKGDYEVVKSMIDAGVDVNGVYETRGIDDYISNGSSAFRLALENNNRNVMQLLLERGADVNGYRKFDGSYYCYLVNACRKSDLELIKYLHNWGADINGINTEPNYTGITNCNALAYLIYECYAQNYNFWIETARYLIQNGIDINHEDSSKRTALVHAVDVQSSYTTDYSMIDLLIANGADIYATNDKGRNIVQIAIDKQDTNLYKHLRPILDRGQQHSPIYQQQTIAQSQQQQLQRQRQQQRTRNLQSSQLAPMVKDVNKLNASFDEEYNAYQNELAAYKANPSQQKAFAREQQARAERLGELSPKYRNDKLMKGLHNFSVGEREIVRNYLDAKADAIDSFIILLQGYGHGLDASQLNRLSTNFTEKQTIQQNKLKILNDKFLAR